MNNQEIRNAAKKKGVTLWQIADLLEVSEATMTRKLRRELPEKERKHILNAIALLAAAKEAEMDE